MNIKNYIITIVLLALAGYVALKSYVPAEMDQAKTIKVANFPMEIGEWSGTEISVSEKDYEILETRNLFVRDYKNKNGDSVYIYVVYSEDNRKVSHPPEVCFMGSGLTITDKKSTKITDNITANKLLVEKRDSRELVIYWYKAGNSYTDKYLKQQFTIVLNRMIGKRTSGALIRLSTPLLEEEDEQRGLALLKDFTSQIEPYLDKYLP